MANRIANLPALPLLTDKKIKDLPMTSKVGSLLAPVADFFR
jgi:hypothetical protein